MKVLIVSSEAVPYCKTGGLADVVGTLLRELNAAGIDAWLFLPYYSKVINKTGIVDTGLRYAETIKGKVFKGALLRHKKTYFVDAGYLFDRDGIYGDDSGDYRDNHLRYSFFCRAVIYFLKALNFRPDLIHLNDWQTALVPLYLRDRSLNDAFYRGIATVLTIHNLGYQGVFPAETIITLGVDRSLFNPEGIEYYGNVNFLKAGILFADFITTVSRRYADEITTAEYGFGLDGVLKKRKGAVFGILNGIDSSTWSPEHDRFILRNYSVGDLRGRAYCRFRLIRECKVEVRGGYPVFSFIGRIASQKGVDLILKILPWMMDKGLSLIVLGTGEAELEKGIKKFSSDYPGRIYIKNNFSEPFAHALYAASDIVLMPSRYEPCGLVQMIALRYGAIPVARNTGGISDTVEDYDVFDDTGTGFLFDDCSASSLLESLKRAVTVYVMRKRWHSIMRRGMKMDFSWKHSLSEYIDLYRRAIEGKVR